MQESIDALHTLFSKADIEVGIICGSGLGGLADHITEAIKIDYIDIPGFPVSTVKGHQGQLIKGFLKEKSVLCFSGRFHFYEGFSMDQVTLPVRIMKCFNIKLVFLTNATGSLDPERYQTGDIVMIKDHISFPCMSGFSPLIGDGNFVALNHVYTDCLNEAKNIIPTVKAGIYVNLGGPHYETPAEVHFLKAIGGDIVGMSTIPEVIMAAALKIKVVAFSLVTNIAADSNEHPNHKSVLKVAKQKESEFIQLLVNLIPKL